MNYYEHHIRDYDAATSHLSWDEDMAYSRLIRWYYRKEKPIPADLKEACRQVRAISKAQRDAVETVLREFFVLKDDGWHKDDCDALIEKFLSGEPERQAKKKNEDTRLNRHRLERAELFAIINAAGEHRPYNAPIAELRELANKLSAPKPNTPETQNETPETVHATVNATSATDLQRLPNTQYPSPNTHPPVIKSNISEQASGEALPPSGELPPDSTRKGRVCKLLRQAGMADAAPSYLTDETWAAIFAKRTDEEIVGVAVAKMAARPGQRTGLKYIAPVLLQDPEPIHPGATNAQNRESAADICARFTGQKRDGGTTLDGEAERVA